MDTPAQNQTERNTFSRARRIVNFALLGFMVIAVSYVAVLVSQAYELYSSNNSVGTNYCSFEMGNFLVIQVIFMPIIIGLYLLFALLKRSKIWLRIVLASLCLIVFGFWYVIMAYGSFWLSCI